MKVPFLIPCNSLSKPQDILSQTGHSNPRNVNAAFPTQRERRRKGETVMSGNSSKSSNSKIMVPEARAAMDKFKMEAANEVGVAVPS